VVAVLVVIMAVDTANLLKFLQGLAAAKQTNSVSKEQDSAFELIRRKYAPHTKPIQLWRPPAPNLPSLNRMPTQINTGTQASVGYSPINLGNAIQTQTKKGKIPMQYIKTSGGGKTLVNAQYAQAFQGLINELENKGYKINQLYGFQNRNVRNTNTASKHMGGYAIDINPGRNPWSSRLQTQFNPSIINQILKKYPMFEWGGNWKSSKDAMHFSVKKPIYGYSGL
jgi:hypothetical protein